MELNAEVAVISIFGRGHWLAARLAEAKVPVTLLEVSDQMGLWGPEDVEGPFGFFECSGLDKERLVSDEGVLPVEQGLSLWLSDGPLELRGPTAAHRLFQLGISAETIGYIQGSKKIEDLKRLDFRSTWLAHFSHAFGSSISTLAPESFKEGLRRPLFSPFYIRQSSKDSLEKSLKWCESRGVKVLRQVELKDLSFEEGKNLAGFEVRTDRPGLFKAEQFVLCLTAEECGMLSAKIQSSLFGNRVHEPEWAWLRYRIRLQGFGPLSHLTLDQLPIHCVWIGDLMLPWSHENLMILQRTAVKDQFDVWLKIPNSQRFNSQYLQERGQSLKAVIESRLPENEVLILDLPEESRSTFEKSGPARHPVFSRAIRLLRKSLHIKNLSLDSPEDWPSLSWEGQFEYQNRIFEDLKSWWDKKEELRLKREAKEAAKRKNQGVEK